MVIDTKDKNKKNFPVDGDRFGEKMEKCMKDSSRTGNIME